MPDSPSPSDPTGIPDHQKVAVYYSNSDIRIEERPVPRPGPGEILVRVRASGLCGSDLMEWYRKPKAPVVLGHEVSAEVVAVGTGVTRFKAGDRVVVTHHVPCMVCHYCSTGRHTVCDTLRQTHFDPGGFAQYIRIPAINVERGTLKIPDSLDDDIASFTEPLGCVLRGQRKIGLFPGCSVLIVGCGISGLLHLLAARVMGAGTLIGTDLQPSRLDLALKLGATHVFQSGKEDIARAVRNVTQEGVDFAIVCAGARSAVHDALQAVNRGGTVLFFAPLKPEERLEIIFNETFWRNGITLTSSYGAAPADLQSALALLASGRVDPTPLITHRLPLEDTARGFQLAIRGEALKIIIKP